MLIRLYTSASRSVDTGTMDEATDRDTTDEATVAVSGSTVTAIAINEKATATVSDRRQFDRWLAEIAENEPVAQGQYVVSDTRCPALHYHEFE